MSDQQGRVFTLQWPDLLRWDLKSARAAAFRAAHPGFRPLGEFIEESTVLVHPSKEPSHNWPVFGVNNKGGVRFSHFQLGKTFNSAYKRISKDWFFHNPTRANVGSLGRVPEVPADAITSPEYQVWKIKRGLLPEFVEILIRLPFFLDLIEYHRVGAVKERLFIENLCEIPIPTLSEADQLGIINRWRVAHNEIAAARARIKTNNAAIESRFFDDLGLQSPATLETPRAFGILWFDVSRWGVRFNFMNKSGADLSRGKYAPVDLESILDSIQYGTSAKAHSVPEGVPIIRMNNIIEGQLDLANLKYLRLPAMEEAKLKLTDGDVLFNRTNSKELVGKCAVFHATGTFVFASYLMRVKVDRSKADPDFVAYVINSPIGRQQIDALSRQIIGQANVNSDELRSLRLPLPPLPVQLHIMRQVSVARTDVRNEHKAVEGLLKNVINEIEGLILGRK